MKTEEITRSPQIIVLGVGNLLLRDEGLGIRVLELLGQRYRFPDNVSLEDGGVLGIHLLGTITRADYLIVIDAIKNGQPPGTLYRLKGEDIPQRILAKNSLHEIDLLEALTLCHAFDKVPDTVILGIEPHDIETISLDLTPVVKDKLEELLDMVLEELKNLGIEPIEKIEKEHFKYVSCDPC
ncbi:MAG: hydrogenase expression/formation protein [Deltaproteobacteria bacterium]|nr:MAG: hydrogenase expression/formation protein [Deltaproteobacteria bacterium]